MLMYMRWYVFMVGLIDVWKEIWSMKDMMTKEMKRIVKNARSTLRRHNIKLQKISIKGSPLWLSTTGYSDDDDSDISIRLSWLLNFDYQYGYEVVLHEFMHAWLFQNWSRFSRQDKAKWCRYFGKYHGTVMDYVKNQWKRMFRNKDDSKYISDYASTDPHEDWAESATAYLARYEAEDALPAKKVEFCAYLLKKYK